MSLLSPSEGLAAMWTRILNGGGFALSVGLFKNNLTVAAATVFGDVTAATFTGYAPIALTDGNWVVTTATPSVASYAQQTFTCSAVGTDETIYGYYIFRGTTLFWAERFPAANIAVINSVGATRKVTPRITRGMAA